uniref:Uncharacterized protein n=2 Tax=Macaca mulatta TaxID=9544 RepID=A0A5F8AIN5_MACMU
GSQSDISFLFQCPPGWWTCLSHNLRAQDGEGTNVFLGFRFFPVRSPRFQHDSRASGEKPVGHSTPACLAWGTLPSIAHHASSPPDALQRELVTTQHLLAALDVGDSEENVQVLDLLSELKDVTEKKDLELRRSFSQVLGTLRRGEQRGSLGKPGSLGRDPGRGAPQPVVFQSRWCLQRISGEHPRTRACLRTTTRVPHQPPLRPRSSARRKTFLEAAREKSHPRSLVQGGTCG